MAKVRTVVEGYTGVRASVAFVNGVGETDDPHLLDWFREHGYQVEDAEQAAETKPKKAKRKKGA